METKYDILVVGSEISGLIAAALVAREGYRVAVISGGEGACSYEKDGYSFNKRPLLITGMNGGPLGRVLDSLRLPKETGVNGDIPYQVVLPDERIDIYGEDELFFEELRRCFPEEIDKVSEFYTRMSVLNEEIRHVMEIDPFSFRLMLPSGIRKGKRPLRDMAEGLGLSRRFQSFIKAQISSFSYLYGPASGIAASSVLESSRRGIYCREGGLDRLKGLLLEKIRGVKGDFILSPVKDISRNGNRWLLRTEEEALSARAVIGNINASEFCGLFLDGSRKYIRRAEKVEKASYPFTVNLGLKDTGLPVGMAENVIMLRDYVKEPVFDNLLFMQTTSPVDGRKGLSVNCHVPREYYLKERAREISEKVLEGVDGLMPFIDRHVETMDARFYETPEDGIFADSLKQRMGVGVLPYQVSEGVFLAGPEVFPALGFDGLVYSGEKVASAAIKGFENNDKP